MSAVGRELPFRPEHAFVSRPEEGLTHLQVATRVGISGKYMF